MSSGCAALFKYDPSCHCGYSGIGESNRISVLAFAHASTEAGVDIG